MHIRLVAVAVVLLLATGLIAGCETTEPEPEIQPAVAPPVILEEGVLKVGVDLEYPPFAGTDMGREAGLDIDVASAIASNLGLELETVEVKPSDAATALADGTVDAVMSVPFTEETLVSVALAGTYVNNGPAFFVTSEGTASVEPSLTVETLGTQKVGAQEASEAYWILENEYGADAIASYPTLREAIEALDAGEIDVLAGDAMVTAYIADDFESVKFAGQVAPATPLAVAAAQDATELEEALRSALDQLAADGVLATIRAKWVGDLPELETEAAE
jgi:polar amino acid transport system substrate-binding protein